MNILTIYRLLAEIVETSENPAINTFAVLKDNADLNTDNLQKTLQHLSTPIFFSRDMDNNPDAQSVTWSFPALIVNNNTVSLKKPFGDTGEVIYLLELHLLFSDQDTPFELLDDQAEKAMLRIIRRFARCKEVGGAYYLEENAPSHAPSKRVYHAIQNKVEGQLDRIEQQFTNHKAVGVSFQMRIASPICDD